jgi:flagellar hook-length control protein FliK
MAAIAVAGVGMMVMCGCSSVAAVMMGGEEKEDPDVPSTTTGTDSGADDSGADKAATDKAATDKAAADKAAADKAAADKAATDKAAADKAAADKAAADAVAATAAAAAAANAAAAAEQTRIASFTVGTPVQCTANDVGSGANSAVYRLEAGKKLRHYPNPPIATSWDADWGTTYKKIDCIGFTQGPVMAHNVTVGTPVQCTANDVGSGANSAVYRVEAGKKLRHYPNPPIATSWDADWGTTYKKIDCIGFTQGPAMKNISNLDDKDAQCYLDRYPDLQNAFGPNNTSAAKTHWINHGKGENRNPLC